VGCVAGEGQGKRKYVLLRETTQKAAKGESKRPLSVSASRLCNFLFFFYYPFSFLSPLVFFHFFALVDNSVDQLSPTAGFSSAALSVHWQVLPSCCSTTVALAGITVHVE
jgi:hypothetical protein